MSLPQNFTNSDAVMDKLTKVIGRLCLDVTNYKVVEADDTIPKVEGPYILVDLSDMEQIDWHTNEFTDEDGIRHVGHNYLVTYTLTAYRGKPYWALSRVCQSFALNFIYSKYFPQDSQFAYSSCSNIARMRIPLNQQYYENRARVQLSFNVTFTESDYGAFENLETVIIGGTITDPGPGDGEFIDDSDVTVEEKYENGETFEDQQRLEYQDRIADIVIKENLGYW